MTSIRRRLTLVLALHLAAAITAGGVVLWALARRAVTAQFDATLSARAELIQATIEEDDGHLEIEFNLSRLRAFQGDRQPVHFEIWSRTGESLMKSAGFGGLGIVGTNPDAAGAAPVFGDFNGTGGRQFRGVLTQFDAADDLDGNFRGLRLLLVSDRAELNASLLRMAGIAAGCALLSMLLLLPLLRRVLDRGLRPLQAFARRTAEIDLSRLPHTVPAEESPAEIRPLVDKLNELLERVHQSLLRERRFTRDVAHELRTPVAELKSIAELVARWSEEATPAAFADVGNIAAEMESLVTGLTLLNRLDAGTAAIERKEVDPAAAVRQALDRLAGRMAGTGTSAELAVSGESPVWQTDPALWRIAAFNLIENAVCYSPPGAVIRITLTASAFEITNPAPELSADDAGRMTQAFWRKDGARSDQLHSGLGLALVDSIVRALGMTLSLELKDNGTLCVRIAQCDRHGVGQSE